MNFYIGEPVFHEGSMSSVCVTEESMQKEERAAVTVSWNDTFCVSWPSLRLFSVSLCVSFGFYLPQMGTVSFITKQNKTKKPWMSHNQQSLHTHRGLASVWPESIALTFTCCMGSQPKLMTKVLLPHHPPPYVLIQNWNRGLGLGYFL